MALTENVKTIIATESATAHTQQMLEARGTRSISNGIVRMSAAKQYDEPSPTAARSIDKVLRLPVK